MAVAPKRRAKPTVESVLPAGEPTGIDDIRDALIIRERDIFLLTDADGNVPRENRRGLGLYHADTRHLSVYDFSVVDTTLGVLLSTAELGFAEEQVLTNPRFTCPEGRVVPRGTIEVRRQRVVADVLEETLRVANYHLSPVTLELLYRFDADFADIFEVRGEERQQRGRLLPPRVDNDCLIYAYEGLDGERRETSISFSPAPAKLTPTSALFRVTLPRRGHASYRIIITLDGLAEKRPSADRFRLVSSQYRRWAQSCTQVFTNNEFFNKALDRSLNDLRMLWSEDRRHEHFPAAGTPWFDALFGRDSCIVSMQTLPYRPEVAHQCLRTLARWQGAHLDPWRDEEPGKIPHELRRGEMSAVGELPYDRYYGSVDSTPLFLWLAAEYYRWTADLRLMRELRPNLTAALEWIDTIGDLDGDGFVEYEKHSSRGLVNQGWKDSSDAIIHTEGMPARPPIALVEVQGYVYAAKLGLVPVFEALGDSERALRLRREAAALRRRFNRDFWLEDERFLALALDGDNRPCASITTNPGHALWTGIVDPAKAQGVVERLLRNDVFTGWGLRTLSASSPRFNPLGYHLGTVWPHDNAICAMGFKRYGSEEELNEVATALFDAAMAFDYYRLPELFSGDPRSAHHAPVPYPVACRPQAWAAGALPMILHAILGLQPDGPERRLRIVRPRLPYWLDTVQLKGLRVGRGHADLLFERQDADTRVHVLASEGLDIEVVGRWTR